MSKISILVPVYNAESKIEKCLNSLINQTDKDDIEIVIVNDGSTDNSGNVIEEYIKKHEKNNIIRYYAKENEGISKTRNFAIDKSNSEYVLFVDADDYIDEQTIEKLKPYIEENIDLIKFKLQRVDENNNILEKVDGPVFEEITGEEAFTRMYSEDILIDSPCVYLMKKELFTKNNFKFQRTYHEDFGLIPFIILVAKTVVSIPDYLYQYVQSSNSITRNEDYKKTIKKINDVLAHYDNMIKTIQNMSLKEKTKENVKIYYTNAIILKLEDLKDEDKDKYIEEIKERKMYSNIKVRNLKQLIKKMLLLINIKLYLRMR